MPWLCLYVHLKIPCTLTPPPIAIAMHYIGRRILLAKPVFQQRTWENMGMNDWIVFMFFPRNWPTWEDLCPLFRILLQLTGEWDRMDNKWWQFCLSMISIGRLDWNKQIRAGSFKFYKMKISMKHFAIWDSCPRECTCKRFCWKFAIYWLQGSLKVPKMDFFIKLIFEVWVFL